MGKYEQESNKKATKYFIQRLADGKGITYSQMVAKARLEYGYTDRWVNKFLSDFEAMISKEEGGIFRWKS